MHKKIIKMLETINRVYKINDLKLKTNINNQLVIIRFDITTKHEGFFKYTQEFNAGSYQSLINKVFQHRGTSAFNCESFQGRNKRVHTLQLNIKRLIRDSENFNTLNDMDDISFEAYLRLNYIPA